MQRYIIIIITYFSSLRRTSLEFCSLATTWILKGINEREGLWPRRMHSGSWCTGAAAAVVHQGAGCADPCTVHTTFNISASWHPPCCCCVCAPLCTQCIAECSSSIFTPSFPPPPSFPSTAAAMAAILHLLMPLEHNAAFLTHKLHSEGKWQNWMRHNLEGNNFLSTSSRKNAPSTGFWWRAFFLKTKLVLGYWGSPGQMCWRILKAS